MFHRLSHLLGLLVLIVHTNYVIREWGELDPALRWAGIGFILLFVEFNFQHAIAILFAAAAFLMMFLASVMSPEQIGVQLLAFFILSAIGFNYRPRILKYYLKMHKTDSHVAPSERVLGSSAVCQDEIAGFTRPGMVRIDGHDWKALETEGRDVSKGEKVTVIGRQDMTLLVVVESGGEMKAGKMAGRLTGVKATWIGNDSAMMANTTRKAVPWPPGTHLEVGQAVKIVGAKGHRLLVERDWDVVNEFDQMKGAIAVCRDAIDGLTHTGSAILNHVIWSARAVDHRQEIKVGEPVRVVNVESAILIVEHVKDTDTTEADGP